MVFELTIQPVLRVRGLVIFPRHRLGGKAHEVPIRSSHSESTIPTCNVDRGVTITGDVTENMTSSPMPSTRPSVPFQWIGTREVIPGSKYFDPGNRRMDLSACMSIFKDEVIV